MWLHFALLLLVGAAFAEENHVWKTKHEYRYHICSETRTDLDVKDKLRTSGIQIGATLTIQWHSPEILRAAITAGHYLYLGVTDSTSSESSNGEFDRKILPISGKPFEITIQRGIIRDLKTARNLPEWEINFIKSIVSQLHLDTRGENARRDENFQIPTNDYPYGMFVTMEDSVGGKCEVLYDMLPMSEYEIQKKRELIPMPHIVGDGTLIEVRKVKNYSNCEEQSGYYFGKMKSPFHADNTFVLRSTTSRTIISGKVGDFTMQTSNMKNKIFVKPLYDWNQSGTISSKINLTLAAINTEYKPLEVSNDLVSTKDLIYVYDKPFVDRKNSKFRYTNNKHHVSESSIEDDYISSLHNHKSSNERVSSERGSSERGSSEKGSNGRGSNGKGSNERDSKENRDRKEKRDSGERNIRGRDWSYYSEELGNSEITMDQDLDTPVEAYFMSYMKNDKINLATVQKIVREIAVDLDNSDDVLLHGTLEKFLIVVRVLRSLNSRELATLEKDLQLSSNNIRDDGSANGNPNVWKVYRDAVAHVGTGPALITIRRWLSERKLVGFEAAMTVSRLSKTVGVLTPQYVKGFFEMVKDPNTSTQMFLQDILITVFGELIRDSRYNCNYITRHIRNEKVREDPAIVDTYIPYMTEELHKAVKEGNRRSILTYIRALGNTGHPKILSIFEPYLEGKLPISTIQRTSMVASLDNLIRTSPRIVRSVLYKIYLNRQEAHEVRCMAVFLLMKTNPSLVMLLHMAESTNYDTDRNVNSMIQSVIENAVESNVFNNVDLSRKASIARRLLNSQHYSNRYSKNYVERTFISKNYVYKYLTTTINSDDMDIPKGLYISENRQFQDFHPPGTKMGYLISSVKQTMDFFRKKFDSKSEDGGGSRKNLVEDIARTLNIQSPDPLQLEGHVYWNSEYGHYYFSFDKSTIEKVIELLLRYFPPLGKTQDININQLNTYQMGISLPTETGLPFLFSLKEPLLLRVKGRNQFDGYFHPGSGKYKANVALKTTLARQIQKTTGFMTPFDGLRHDVGFYTNTQLYVPVETQWDTNSETRTSVLKVRMFTDKNRNKLLHRETIPFVWFGNINNIRPRYLTEGYRIVRTEKPRKVSFETGKLSVDLEVDNENSKTNLINYSDYYWLISKILLDDINFSKLDLYWTDRDKNDWVVIKFVQHDVEITASNNLFSLPKIPITLHTESSSKKRIERITEELGKGFASGTAKTIDISIDIPKQGKGLLTISLLNDETEKKLYSLLYGNVRSVEDKEDISEVSVSLQSQSKPILSGLDVDETLRNPPKDEFKLSLVFGDVTKGQQVKIEGKQTQNDDWKNWIKNSNWMKKCREEMDKGNKGLPACHKVNSLANILNQLELSMNIESQYVNMLADVLKSLSNKHMGTTYTLNTMNNDEQKIDMKLLLSPDLKMGDLSFSNSLLNLSLPYHSPLQYLTMLWGIPLHENTWTWTTWEDHLDENNEREVDSCILDVNMARTFDNNVYPLKLGHHWHAMVTTVPQLNPDNPNELLLIPSDLRVSVLARQRDMYKEVKLIVGDTVIELRRTVDGMLEITVNGKRLSLVRNKIHREEIKDRRPIDIIELEDGSIKIVDEEFSLVYDGLRVQIEMSSKFRNVVSGLCGNYDLNLENDFLTPERCVELNPEEFVASYVMIRDNSYRENTMNKSKVDRSNKCIRITERQSNVISDLEAGRNRTEGVTHLGHRADKHRHENKFTYNTMVIETSDQICFSNRPVLRCNKNCKPVEVKSKKYSFHCMPNVSVALEMKNRIENGANPDLSRKSVHFSKALDIPIDCKTA